MTKFISWLTGLLTLLLALFSFVLSFNALTDLAHDHGVSIPWMFPFVVEFAVVIFSLNALWRSMNGYNTKVQWTMIIMSSLLAGTFNVIHAQDDIVSKVMAAMPSFFLLLSFESFLNFLKHSVNHNKDSVKSDDNQNDKIINQDFTLSNRQKQIVKLLSTGEAITRIADKVKVSTPTVYKELKELETVGVTHKNGNGWEVKV